MRLRMYIVHVTRRVIRRMKRMNVLVRIQIRVYLPLLFFNLEDDGFSPSCCFNRIPCKFARGNEKKKQKKLAENLHDHAYTVNVCDRNTLTGISRHFSTGKFYYNITPCI